MDLSTLQDGILIDIDSDMGVTDVFGEVAQVLTKANKLDSGVQTAIQEAFLARERDGTTAFGFGIALPHVFHPSLSKVQVVVVRHREGVDLGAFDGVPTNTMVCVAAPEGEREAYLELLKHLAQVSREQRWRRFIQQSPSAAGVLDVLIEAGAARTWQSFHQTCPKRVR